MNKLVNVPTEDWVHDSNAVSCPVCSALMCYGKADAVAVKTVHRNWHIGLEKRIYDAFGCGPTLWRRT